MNRQESGTPFVSVMLVAAQMIVFIALLASARWPSEQIFAGSVIVAGGALGLWALLSMRRSRLRALPEVHPQARLITTGPYRWIRHPMYTALVSIGLGAWLTHPTLVRFFLLLALSGVLALKIRREEACLRRAFPEYENYAARTARLCPGIW